GQVDYAFANHYMDAFAHEREQRRARGERSGKTLSLNWSLWADGGMSLDAATEAFFRKQLGIRPLSTAFGLDAFAQGLLAERPQLAVLDAIQERIERAWGLAPAPKAAAPSAAEGAGDDLAGAVVAALSESVVGLLKLDPQDLSVDAILTDLGFGFMGLMAFACAINVRYGLDLNASLFFEYPSIQAIAGTLVDKHRGAVSRQHAAGGTRPAERTAPPAATPAPAGLLPGAALPIDKSHAAASSPAPAATAATAGSIKRSRFADMPIAIVGIAGV